VFLDDPIHPALAIKTAFAVRSFTTERPSAAT
jgi:hypothetical protein